MAHLSPGLTGCEGIIDSWRGIASYLAAGHGDDGDVAASARADPVAGREPMPPVALARQSQPGDGRLQNLNRWPNAREVSGRC